MPVIFRLVDRSGQLLADLDSIESAGLLSAGLIPGRYIIDEIRSHASADGYSSRRWGAILRFADGAVLTEQEPGNHQV